MLLSRIDNQKKQIIKLQQFSFRPLFIEHLKQLSSTFIAKMSVHLFLIKLMFSKEKERNEVTDQAPVFEPPVVLIYLDCDQCHCAWSFHCYNLKNYKAQRSG